MEIRFSVTACARVSHLRLHCMDPARGTHRILRVPSTLIEDNVIHVAACINDAKLRFLSMDTGGGGGSSGLGGGSGGSGSRGAAPFGSGGGAFAPPGASVSRPATGGGYVAPAVTGAV